MPHAAGRRRRAPGDEPRYRLLGPALLDEIGALHFGVAADLADHDDALGLVVGDEHLQAIDEAGAVDRIAPDADAGRLAEPDIRRLRHRLVGQRAGTRDDADAAAAMDVTRHDADLALVGRDDAQIGRAHV